MSGKPEAAVADGKGKMFVNIEDKNEVVAINTTTHAVVSTWPVPGCNEPAGLDLDAKTNRLFVGCHNKVLVVLNVEDGKVVTTLPIGDGVDANAFDSETKLLFSSQGDGTLTIIKQDSPNKFTVLQNVTTQPGARTMALDTNNHSVYLVSAEFDELAPAAGQTRPRRTMKPGTFTLLVISKL